MEDEWKADGGPYDCVYFVNIEPRAVGASPTHCCAMSLLGELSLLRPYHTHLGPSVAYILTIPSGIGRHGELNAPTGRCQFVMLRQTLSPNTVSCLHPRQLEPHKQWTEPYILGHGSPSQAGGYCHSPFLTLWFQIETVPSEPADVNVLYLVGECKSADMKLGRRME